MHIFSTKKENFYLFNKSAKNKLWKFSKRQNKKHPRYRRCFLFEGYIFEEGRTYNILRRCGSVIEYGKIIIFTY